LYYTEKTRETPKHLKPASEAPSVALDDMILSPSLKQDLRRSVQHLREYSTRKQPSQAFRARRGILLLGPSGVGKTSIARALAHEAGCSFISISATELMEVYVGIGPKRVRDIFTEARECDGPCIIFIDELDALGVRQSNSLLQSVGQERNSTINQLLVEIDGFADDNQEGKILLIAASNRKEMIDPALLRSGRFDIKIFFPLPDSHKRAEILYSRLCKMDSSILEKDPSKHQSSFRGQLSHRGLDSDYSESGSELSECPRRRQILIAIEELATRTAGYSPADLVTILNEATYIALADGREKVESPDLIHAFSRVKQGVEAIKESPQNGQ
jgi:ATP-dependent Zn protease